MTKCVSPIPPPPDPGFSTQTTCASIDVEGISTAPPSNCPCPDTILDYPIGNFEHYWDRFWNVGAPPVRVQKQYIVALLVNKNGLQYDQIFIHSQGECDDGRVDRFEVQVLNRPGIRKIAAVKYNSAGVVTATLFDVDMSPTFGDGQPHWVVIVASDEAGERFGLRVFVDATEIGFGDEPSVDLSDFVKLQVVGNAPGESVPMAMWQYQPTTVLCLTSGTYNGLGGCQRLSQESALRWDRGATDLNINLFNAERVISPVVGPPIRRNAYLTHPKMSGRVYWEIDRGEAGNCRADNFYIGAAEPAILLGSSYPGQVPGSWGLAEELGRLWADGNLIADSLQVHLRVRNMFCYDVQTRQLWFGYEEGSGGRLWVGGGEPGAGATSWVLFSVVRDLRLVYSFLDYPGSVFISSSAESCQFPAPAGFGYLT